MDTTSPPPRFSLRFVATLLLSGAIYTILVGLASVWFLRHLGGILAYIAPSFGVDAETTDLLSSIFGQLKTASLDLPLEVMGLFCYLYCGLSLFFLHHRKKLSYARVLALVILCGVLLFLPLTAVTIWFTDVNDIRLDTVITSLSPLWEAGIL